MGQLRLLTTKRFEKYPTDMSVGAHLMSLIQDLFERIFRGQSDISVDLTRHVHPCLGGYSGGEDDMMLRIPTDSAIFGGTPIKVGQVVRLISAESPCF